LCCSERGPFFAAQSAKKRTPLCVLDRFGKEVISLTDAEGVPTALVAFIAAGSRLIRYGVFYQALYRRPIGKKVIE
jgi:hypothetical protein